MKTIESKVTKLSLAEIVSDMIKAYRASRINNLELRYFIHLAKGGKLVGAKDSEMETLLNYSVDEMESVIADRLEKLRI